jgi:hypothetical protein
MDFKVRRLAACGNAVATESWPLKKKCCNPRSLFYSLKSSYVPVPEAWGLAEYILSDTPYSVREWCRFLTKLSRLLSKSDCFQPVSFDSLCNHQFRCRGVSIISFACVMTDSSILKNSQTAAEGPQSSIFVSHLCLLAEMSSWSIIYCSSTAHDEHTD